MEQVPQAELPITAYQLAEQYHVGQPLALYNMQPQWIRICQVITRAFLGGMICDVLFFLIPIAVFFYQYLELLHQHSANLSNQIAELQWKIIWNLPNSIIAFMSCFAFMIARNMIVKKLPVSFLVCTEGLLEIRPKEVDATHWSEVRGSLQGPGLGKKKSYKLYRINRKPLTFGDAFENVESLAYLVRQQILKG